LRAREHLRPQYSKAFRCIGSDCEDTCCHGFAVTIDRATYQRYERNPKFQPLLDTHFIPITAHPTEEAYARIKLTPASACPFLTVERLCGIQQEHGSDYLSEMCTSYPRVSRRVDGLMEKALYLSCPEAARLVLLNPNLLTSDRDVVADRSRYFQFLHMGARIEGTNGSPHQFLWEIRGFTLLLLRDRSYPLWQRLFILGMFCNRLNEMIARREGAFVPQLLRNYAQMIEEGKLRGMMDGIPVPGEAQLVLVMEIVRRNLAIQVNDPSHVRFHECVQDFLKGIQYEDSSTVESRVPFLAEARRIYYEPFMRAQPFIVENYLVNHVFKTRFPFGVNAQGEPNTPQREFLVMAVLYAAVNGLLTGMAGFYREKFVTAHVVKLVQSFSKAVEHCPEFLKTLNPELASGEGLARVLKS